MKPAKSPFLFALLSLLFVLSSLFITCGDPASGDPASPKQPAKTVSVGPQSGTLSAGTAGTVSFPVTTENIADGSYTVTVANLPAGVTVSGNVTISNKSGTLTLAGTASVAAGARSNLILTIDGASSKAFAITVSPARTKSVSVGTQVGILAEGEAGTVTYAVTTSNIADGAYTAAVANLPAGVTVSGDVAIIDGSGTLTLAGSASTVAGTATNLTLAIDGATSAAFSLAIGGAKSVSVGLQSGTLAAGSAGSVSFPVTTANIANGSYSAAVANLPAGATVSGNVDIINGSGTLTIAGNASTVAGTTTNLTLAIDGATSEAFTLTVSDAATKSVSVGAQSGTMTAGTGGTVTFPVTTANIADGEYTATVANLPAGVTVQGDVTISSGSGTLTLSGTDAVTAGEYSTLALTIDSAQSGNFTLTVAPSSPKTVSVGTQIGTLTAGVVGTVSYNVTTANISNGTYAVTVANRPAGVSVQGDVTISGNSGTLTLDGDTSTVAGTTSNLTLSIDGATSANFSLAISSPALKTVSVGTQNGTLTAGVVGTVTYNVMTANISNGTYAVTVANRPAGVSVQGDINISGNSGTLTLAGNTSTVSGTTTNLTLAIDGATSAAFNLTITALAPKTVSVGEQVGTLTAGAAGTVTYAVTTANIANGTYAATVANRPAGVTIGNSGNVTISGNSGTLTLAGNTSTVAGTTTNLTLAINGATSAAFSLAIGGAKSVSVGTQSGTLTAGSAGSVSFPVTTANIANGSYSAAVANLPAGATVSGNVDIIDGSGTLTIAGNASTTAGATSNLTLTIDNVTSSAFTLTVSTPATKSVSVGSQSGTMTAGAGGTVTFPVTTANIANGTYSAAVANLPSGVSIGNSGNISISGGSGALTLSGTASVTAGEYFTLALTIDSTQSGTFTLTVAPSAPKTVSVGTQIGTLTAGVVGTVTYPVTTANIANGTYTVTVANRPAGVSVQGDVTISGDSGTLTLDGNTSTIAGTTSNLTLSINGATSENFSLAISSPPKSVSVGTQNGTLTAGVSGTITFPVTTANIANGTYTATVANRPAGVTASGTIAISSDSGTLTLAGSTSTVAGTTSNLTLTIDGTTSNNFTLTIVPAPKSVSVGTQNGTLTAGTGGTVTFPVTTANIANGPYTVTVANLPGGVSVGNSGNVTISGNSGTLTLAGSTSTVAGTTSNLTLTIDSVTSNNFTLTIVAAPKSVTVGSQIGTLTAGVVGTVTFPVTTANIANGTYTATAANRPTGVIVAGSVTITGNSGTLTLAGSTSTVAGTTTNLTLAIDGTTSNNFTLTIAAPPPKVTVGTQVGSMTAGAAADTVVYPVTTTGIANGSYIATVNNRPTGVNVQGNITISLGEGALTLAGSVSTAIGNYTNLTLTINGTTSAAFSLNITADTTPPVLSVSTLTVSNVTISGFTISWTKATDNVTPQNQLRYYVNYAASSIALNNFPLLANTGGTVDINTYTFTNMNPGQTRYFYVTVEEAAGNRRNYTSFNATTSNGNSGTPDTSSSWYTSGASSYTIMTADQLAGLAQLVNNNAISFSGKTITLGRSIDISVYGSSYNSGNGWIPIGNSTGRMFSGTFNGNGYTISNLYSRRQVIFAGLFDNVVAGQISNLNLTNVNVSSTSDSVGGLAGYLFNSTVTTINLSGTVSQDAGAYDVGGIAGQAANSSLVGCYVNDTTSSVTGWASTGGVVGYLTGSTMQWCGSNGTVTGRTNGANTGGIVGFAEVSHVQDCVSNVAVIGNNQKQVGGIAGRLDGLTTGNTYLRTSYSTGAVSGNENIGGLVGWLNNAEVRACYSTGVINGTNYVGGLVGFEDMNGSIIICYSLSKVYGTYRVGGIAGYAQYGSIENCFALNESITCSGTFGRVVGDENGGSWLNSNYAYNNIGGDAWYVTGGTNNNKQGFALQLSDLYNQFVLLGFGSFGGQGWTLQTNTLPGLNGYTVPRPSWMI